MTNRFCEVAGCKKPMLAKKMCQQHYDRKRRYGDTYSRPAELICVDCRKVFDVRGHGMVPEVCDECQIVRHRNRQRADRWRKGLWEYYKITPDDYKQLFDAQNGVCAICKNTATGRGAKNNRLAVDHDHANGQIRGLLCSKCNTGLGLFDDSVELLKIGINYLKETKRNGAV